MSSQQQFAYQVSTALPRDRVWALFADLENWPKFSRVYDHLKWSGVPWRRASCVLGTLHIPHPMPLRYVLETCQPGFLISYVGYSTEAGIATHRIVRFEEQHGRTLIKIDSYIVGLPTFSIAGGSYGLLRMLVETWFRDFASFCDSQLSGGTHNASRLPDIH
jgi:hypothetical protein